VSRIHKINFFLACIILAIDSLNGFFLFKGINLPISQVFKLLFTATMIIGLIKLSYHKFVIWFVLFVLFVSIFNLVNNPIFFFESLVLSQKFLFTILTYFYFTEYFKNSNSLNYNYVFVSSFLVVLLNILISILGIGKFAYVGDVGFTGFFFAPNEISFLVLIILSYLLFQVKSMKSKYLSVIFVLCLIISFMLAMKLVIIGVSFVGVFIFFSGKFNVKKIIIGSLFVLIFVFILFKFSYLLEPLINMIEYRYNSSTSLLNFLLSNRDVYLNRIYDVFINSSAFNLLFGLDQNLTIEMDLFDVLFNFGLFGFLIIYLFYSYVIISSTKKYSDKEYNFFLFINLLIVMSSLFVGHFVFSAMGGFFFAYFNSKPQKKHFKHSS
jgi:hypothetical protein